MTLHTQILERADADIMAYFYEAIEVNFGSAIVLDSTEIRNILSSVIDEVLAEAEKCVGEEKDETPLKEEGKDLIYDYALARLSGWNNCREQTLSNLRALREII